MPNTPITEPEYKTRIDELERRLEAVQDALAEEAQANESEADVVAGLRSDLDKERRAHLGYYAILATINGLSPDMREQARRMADATLHDLLRVESAKAVEKFHTLQPASEYHEDYGDVLWWHVPIQEPPCIGSMLDVERKRDEAGNRVPGTVPRLVEEGWLTYWSPLPECKPLVASDGAEVAHG